MTFSRARAVNIRRETYDVYVGRAGHGYNGYFGNPFAVAEHGPAALDLFARHFERRLADDAEFRARVEALSGLRLGCFCAPGPCHAAIIASWLNLRPWLGLERGAREDFEERAGIREHNGRLDRAEAERAAFAEIAAR